jgi:hypothetical protein
VTNGFVEIIVARIVPQARLQPLKRGWEGPKNPGEAATMKSHSVKSHSISTEPVFEAGPHLAVCREPSGCCREAPDHWKPDATKRSPLIQ